MCKHVTALGMDPWDREYPVEGPGDGASRLSEKGAADEAKGSIFSGDSETLERASVLWGQVTKDKSPGV